MAQPRIHVYRDDADAWRWTLIAANGEVCAQGESHTSRTDAQRAARTAADLMGQALTED